MGVGGDRAVGEGSRVLDQGVHSAQGDRVRDFVLDHLTARPAVAHSETSLIFGHFRGTTPAAGIPCP